MTVYNVASGQISLKGVNTVFTQPNTTHMQFYKNVMYSNTAEDLGNGFNNYAGNFPLTNLHLEMFYSTGTWNAPPPPPPPSK